MCKDSMKHVFSRFFHGSMVSKLCKWSGATDISLQWDEQNNYGHIIFKGRSLHYTSYQNLDLRPVTHLKSNNTIEIPHPLLMFFHTTTPLRPINLTNPNHPPSYHILLLHHPPWSLSSYFTSTKHAFEICRSLLRVLIAKYMRKTHIHISHTESPSIKYSIYITLKNWL